MELSAFLAGLPAGRYFCKPNSGGNGIGALRVDVGGNGLIVDGIPRGARWLAEQLSSETYVIQHSLVPQQHPEIARFNPHAISTIRLVTFDDERGAVAAAAALRSGTGTNAVDNWSAGGVLVPIDLQTGKLTRHGILKRDLAIVEAHPNTGEGFDGRSIPFFADAIALACRLHDKLAITSLGWDIALLKDGPCVLEYNRLWDVYLSLQLNPAFAAAFLRVHLPDPDSSVRVKLSGNFTDRQTLRLWLCAVIGQAPASARVDEISTDRLALTITGTKPSLDKAIRLIADSGSRFQGRNMKVGRTADVVRPGLEIAATFRAVGDGVAASTA
jgi:hypothetical protein